MKSLQVGYSGCVNGNVKVCPLLDFRQENSGVPGVNVLSCTRYLHPAQPNSTKIKPTTGIFVDFTGAGARQALVITQGRQNFTGSEI